MSVEGVLLIDKPKGPSSFDVVRRVRTLTGIKRVGHAGTLDPLASGLMVVALGRYTKLCAYLTEGAKTYEAIIELGTVTSTDDGEGDILSTMPFAHLKEEDIYEACLKFEGAIDQVPPKYSAIKVGGRRAYSMARSDEVFELQKRQVNVFSLELKTIALPYLVVRVHCSKGTYIRSLARDIGSVLGVGAYARAIRRVASGNFKIERALSFEELADLSVPTHLLSGREALDGLDLISIGASDRDNAIHGRPLSVVSNSKASVAFYEDNPVAIVALHGEETRVLRVL